MQIFIDFDTGLSLTIQLEDNDFVTRWCRLLSQELSRNSLLQEDTYSSFFTEEQSKINLERAIGTINKFLKTEFIPLPLTTDYNNPEYYNILHSQFERLAGPDWDSPTRLMTVAPDEIKLAVRHINRYCHRLEQRPYQLEPWMRVEFNTSVREKFEPADFDLFYDYYNETDIVFLDYSTLGKSLFECYEDHLAPDYNGLKIQNHYSSNFVLKFENKIYRRPREGFVDWINEHNLTNLPKSVIGQIKLGEIVEKNMLQSVQETAKILNIRME